MSLKDAIREATEERNKQDSSKAVEQQSSEAVLLQNQEAVPHHNDKTVEQANKQTAKQQSSKAVHKERKQAVQQQSNNAVQQHHSAGLVQVEPSSDGSSSIESPNVETAALTIRVPRSHRIHWLISAKKQDTTLTAAIIEALNARFGLPTD